MEVCVDFDLSAQDVRSWFDFHGFTVPTTVSLRCPHCAELGVFSLANHAMVPDGHVHCAGVCPACSRRVAMWIISPAPSQSGQKAIEGVRCWPAPAKRRTPPFDLRLLPDPVRRAYSECLNSFDVRHWNPAVVMCRRTLEAVVTHYLGASDVRSALANRLQQLKSKVDLQQPIEQMSGVVRSGGNLGAHFHQERETTQDIAEATLMMLEGFLEYIFVIPTQVSSAMSLIDSQRCP